MPDSVPQKPVIVPALGDQIEAQRPEIMTRFGLNLTIVATVLVPLTLITGLLGMNVAGIPDQHNPYRFWLVTGLSVIISMPAWPLLRRQTYVRYPGQASTGKKQPRRLPQTTAPAAAGMVSARTEDRREQGTQCDRPPDT